MKYRVQSIVNNEYLDDDGIFLLPNGEVGYFIEDGSYPYYRKFGHQEYFRVINEDCERLQKQLEQMRRNHKEQCIAIDELRVCLLNCRNYFVSNNIDFFVNQIDKTLKKI